MCFIKLESMAKQMNIKKLKKNAGNNMKPAKSQEEKITFNNYKKYLVPLWMNKSFIFIIR